jgi:hypothetical protein
LEKTIIAAKSFVKNKMAKEQQVELTKVPSEDPDEIVEKIMRDAVCKVVFYHIIYDRNIIDGNEMTKVWYLTNKTLRDELQDTEIEFESKEEFDEFLLGLRRTTWARVDAKIMIAISLAELKNKCLTDQ